MKKFLAIATLAATLGLTLVVVAKLNAKELEEAMAIMNNESDMTPKSPEENTADEAPAPNEETTTQVSDEN